MKKETGQNTFVYRISYEELYYLLNILELNTLPGLGHNPFGNVNSQEKELMLVAGFNSLRAKGWVQLLSDEEHPIGLDRLFVSPLLVCAASHRVLSITKQLADRPPEKTLVFQSPELFVLYRMVELGVYEFIVTTDEKELIAYFKNMVGLAEMKDARVKNEDMFSLAPQIVGQLIELQRKKDILEIRKLLEGNKIQKRVADKYISILKELQHNLTINFMEFPRIINSADQFQGRTISILVSNNSAWAIESDGHEVLIFKQVFEDYFQNIFSSWLRKE